MNGSPAAQMVKEPVEANLDVLAHPESFLRKETWIARLRRSKTMGGILIEEVLDPETNKLFVEKADDGDLSDADFLQLPVVKQAMKAAGLGRLARTMRVDGMFFGVSIELLVDPERYSAFLELADDGDLSDAAFLQHALVKEVTSAAGLGRLARTMRVDRIFHGVPIELLVDPERYSAFLKLADNGDLSDAAFLQHALVKEVMSAAGLRRLVRTMRVDGTFFGVAVDEVLSAAGYAEFVEQVAKADLSDAAFLQLPVVKQAMSAISIRIWDGRVNEVKGLLVQGGECSNAVRERLRFRSWNHVTIAVGHVAAHLKWSVSAVAKMLLEDRPAFDRVRCDLLPRGNSPNGDRGMAIRSLVMSRMPELTEEKALGQMGTKAWADAARRLTIVGRAISGNDDGNDDAALGMLFDQPAEFLEVYTRASSAAGNMATTHNEKTELAEVMVLALQFYKGEVSQPPRPSAQRKVVYAGRFHWVNQRPMCAEFLCRDIDVCGDLQIQREFTPDGKKRGNRKGVEKLWQALRETTTGLSKDAVKNRLKTAQHVRAWQWLHQTLEGKTNLSASQWLEEASSAAASPAAGAPSSDPEGTPSGDGGGSAVPRSLA